MQSLFRYMRETDRVSIGIIDNSNGPKDGGGNIMAWKAEVAARVPCFSHGLVAAAHGMGMQEPYSEYLDAIQYQGGTAGANGLGSGQFWGASTTWSTDAAVNSDAGTTIGNQMKWPAASAAYGTWQPFANGGLALAAGAGKYFTGPTCLIRRQSPLGNNGPFVFRLIGSLTAGAGTVNPECAYIRAFATGQNALVVGGNVSTGAATALVGTAGTLTAFTGATVTEADRTTVTDSGNVVEGLYFVTSYTNSVTGPGCLLYGHVCNTSRTKGACVNGMMVQGSMSAFNAALTLNAAIPQATLKAYTYAVSDLHSVAAGGSGTVRHLIVINLGTYNDMQQSAATDGLTPANRRDTTSYDGTGTNTLSSPAVASNTPQGCYNNVLETITIIRAGWNAQRGANSDKTELFFMVVRHPCTSDTPTAYPNDLLTTAKIEGGMRAAIAQLAVLSSNNYNIAVVDTAQLLSNADLAGLFDYSAGADPAHMQQSGYRYVVGTIIDAIMNYNVTNVGMARVRRV